MGENNSTTTEQGVMLQTELLPCVNLAMVDSHVVLCNRCDIVNNTDQEMHDIVVTVSGDFVEQSTVTVAQLPSQWKVHLNGLAINFRRQSMEGLSTPVDTRVVFVAQCDGNIIAQTECELTMLPDSYWAGLQVMPSLLATMVLGTSSATAEVIKMALPHLERLTGEPVFDNYQTLDPNRSRAQLQALYQALQQLHLTALPMSNDLSHYGEHVRSPREVLDSRMGNSLELALLLASCLEACHLNPLLVLMRSHVMVGVWLVDSYSVNPVSDDSAFLVKASNQDLAEMALLDVMACTATDTVEFDQACQRAELMLRDFRQVFNCFVDIKSCRLQNITPSQSLVQAEGVDAASGAMTLTSDVPSLQSPVTTLDSPVASITKQQIWERKLLDFSMRNNLLNMRIGKRVLPFISFAIEELEDHINNGEDYSILPSPADNRLLPDDTGIYDSALVREQWQRLVLNELNNKRLRSYLNETETVNVLKHIHRTSRTALEENGANSLFLALGILKWYETDRSIKPRYAPILMIPVDLIRHGGNRYVIRSRDEETIINVTLIEMIKQQFQLPMTGLTPLATDKNGVDVRQVMATMRQCIMSRPRWDVLDEAVLGLFSFSKFVMWNDIHNNADQLALHPVIQALASNKVVDFADDGQEPADARQLDQSAAPDEFAIPVDVDSSQFEAIVDSGRGKSFVLHGPPGTGKSQTITNIIANALFQGKRVLFVAEKMAALEVVQKRLKAIGIAPFCLELHSNKATKRHVLEQLDKALNTIEHGSSRDYLSTSRKLAQERESLSHYVLAMHMPRESGLSIYECITRCLDIDVDPLDANDIHVDSLTQDDIAQAEELIHSLDSVVKLTGTPASHPLAGLVILDAAPEKLKQLAQLLLKLAKSMDVMQHNVTHIGELLGYQFATSMSGYKNAAQLCEMLQGVQHITPGMIEASERSQMPLLRASVARGETRSRSKQEVEELFHQSAFSLNATELLTHLREIKAKWFLPRYFAKRKFNKTLAPHLIDPVVDDPEQQLMVLEKFQADDAKCDTTWQAEIEKTFKQQVNKDATEWSQLYNELDVVEKLFQQIKDKFSSKQSVEIVKCVTDVANGNPYFFGQESMLLAKTVHDFDQLQTVSNTLSAYCQFDDPDSEHLMQDSERYAAHVAELGRDWKQWNDRRQLLRQHNLSQVALHIAQGEPVAQVAEAWKKAVYHTLASKALSTDQRLAEFSGVIFEDTIAKFRKLDQKFQELTKIELYNRLARSLREHTSSPTVFAQMGYLRRNIANRGRAQSVRNIMDQISGLLPYLTPCMLMSPISVAQYLTLSQRAFDIVIFDEASQMPTSEAIGAIARGKSLIVVGDPKQMPPTNFFNVNQVDESEEALDDLDSVLDDTIALSFPNKHLRWHYRSRHESLIAFSNSQYYDGRLITFPSMDDRDTKVTFVPVQGTYDYGHSRSNRAEAQAIVDEVLRRLRDKTLQKQSLGIVAFSISQQNLIDDLLMDAFSLHPELERLSVMNEEPIFVKNLENVQGDERDVILFSIGYGPDTNGRVSMNFGPLNNSGGERRLNVAVSRARYEMMVFSTLMPEQIDLNRSKSLGVQGLKMFLEYARDGRISYQSNVQPAAVNVMARQLAECLREKGYQVATAVGRSKFKIDLAVVDPDNTGKYMLGVLCDGKGYSDTKTVRDREVCQPAVLSMLGWNILRIWMVDWFYNRDRVIQQVLDALEQIEKHASHKSQEITVKAQEPVVKPIAPQTVEAKPEIHPMPEPTRVEPPKAETIETPTVETIEPPQVQPAESLKAEPVKAKPKSEPELKAQKAVPVNENIEYREIQYIEAEIPCEEKGGAMMMTTRPTKTMAQMRQILRCEQPITFHYACKRMCRIWGVRNINERVTRYVTWLLKQTAKCDESSTQAVPYYWGDPYLRLSYGGYRIKNGREWHDIPLIEVKNAIIVLLDKHRRVDEGTLPVMVAELFGIKKCGTLFREQVSIALSQLVQDKRILHTDDTYAPRRSRRRN